MTGMQRHWDAEQGTGGPPIPWTANYLERRTQVLLDAVSDEQLLRTFKTATTLPDGYGIGIDERCIEYPWAIAQLPASPRRLLDAGSALNYAYLLDLPPLKAARVHVATQSPDPNSHWLWRPGVSYLFEDLRSLPIADAVYDAVVSISTLEHIGCDNTFYTNDPLAAEQRTEDFVLAVRELVRVLDTGGLLLVTVPYGRYQFHGAFQQFDRHCLTMLEDALKPMRRIEETFYRYRKTGWQLARDKECRDCEYVQWVADVMRTGRWPQVPAAEPDDAANARAVACIAAIK
jgi:hypothetical protein